jgi:hypothetical protein
MADIKYLVTVDSETGDLTKLELVGDAGELTEVKLGQLSDHASIAFTFPLRGPRGPRPPAPPKRRDEASDEPDPSESQ